MSDEELKLSLARAAHDQRNPLQGIIGNAELIAFKSNDPDIRRLCDRLLANAYYLGGVIDSLEGMARAREDHELPGHLYGLVERLQAMFPASAEQQVSINCAGDHALTPGFSVRCSRVLTNLISNGISRSRNVQVEISLENDALTIRVEDDGPGLDYQPNENSKPLLSAGLGIGIICWLVGEVNGQANWYAKPVSHAVVTLPIP